MEQLKLPNDLKEILTMHGVPNGSISLIEEHYSGVIYEVAKEVTEDKQEENSPANEEKQFRDTTREMAEKSRMVK